MSVQAFFTLLFRDVFSQNVQNQGDLSFFEGLVLLLLLLRLPLLFLRLLRLLLLVLLLMLLWLLWAAVGCSGQATLGTFWGSSWDVWALLGALQGPSWSHHWPSWRHLGCLGCLGAPLKPSWGHVKHF